MDILEKLFCNPGLFHVAEHIVSFLDDMSVAHLRLVSKYSNDFLVNIWQNRAQREASRLCKQKLEIFEDATEERKVEISIFEFWPEWKNALREIETLEDISDIIHVLKNYVDYSICYESLSGKHYSSKSSPLHFVAEDDDVYISNQEKVSIRYFEILLGTSLDFNVCDDKDNTPLHRACECGSKEVVELLLDNVVKKGINVKAVNQFNDTIVHCALQNEEYGGKVLKHLFERRKEFDFDISQVNHRDGDNVLHVICCFECIETLEMMFEWSMEQGINVNDVNSDGDNILHLACGYNPKRALFLLESCDKYGLNKSVLASMANVTNNQNERPIDILMNEHPFVKKTRLGRKLIQELEKYTKP